MTSNTDVKEGISPGNFLEALYKVHQENPIHFADPENQSNHINFLVGKMMVETNGQCPPELAMKVIKTIMEDYHV